MPAPYEQNIVLDLEFTPAGPAARDAGLRFEVIQFGAVRVNPDGEAGDSFECFVRPETTGKITWQVNRLTGIRWSDVASAEPFEQGLAAFTAWVGDASTRFVTWSPSDLKQLTEESAYKKIDLPLAHDRWFDLQKVYPRLMGVRKKRGQVRLVEAAEWYCGGEVEREQLHGAPYDAAVTAELFRLLKTGEYLAQKNMLADIVPERGEHEVLSENLGDRFAALAKLRDELSG